MYAITNHVNGNVWDVIVRQPARHRRALWSRHRSVALFVFALLWSNVLQAAAQQRDTLELTLPEITIDAVRETETSLTAPYALSVEVRDPEQIAFEPALSLESVLRMAPGVWVNDRGHFALGERISIRGMGARAPFGVRGIQVLLDGIPLTMPDGQAVVEVIEPAVIRRVETLRSPASIFWGNGSGGVLFLSSGAPGGSMVRGRALTGAYGRHHALLEGVVTLGEHHVHAWGSTLAQTGYREYSRGRLTRAGLIARMHIDERTVLSAIGAGVYQDTENPGSLTREQMEEDPRMARSDFVATRSGKVSTQLQAGLALRHRASFADADVTAYGIRRLLDNPLPYAFVDVRRSAGGVRAALRNERGKLQWGFGADAGLQHDTRKNFDNIQGERGEQVELNQIEDVLSAGAFGYGRLELGPGLHATAGVRYSNVHFKLEDRQLTNDDQSGSRTFFAWSPSVGLSYRRDAMLYFANFGTAFETPTTTELVNRPDMTGGFNPELEPQISEGFELGARGAITSGLFVDVAGYYMNVRGRLISMEGSEGREYFRDAGRNRHVGLEVAATWRPLRSILLEGAYTATRLTFRDDDLKGNLLPGVPEHRVVLAIELRSRGFWSRVEGEGVGEHFVDDANIDVNDGYTVLDVSVGHEGLPIGASRARPFLTVRNVFDRLYSASVVVNAFGGRYYEPAPGRALFAGIEVTL